MAKSLVLIINCGSSSLKYQLIDMSTEESVAKGLVSNIGIAGSMIKHESAKGTVKQQMEIGNHNAAFSMMFSMLTAPETGVISDLNELCAVGHRVLHGGMEFTSSTLVTPEVKAAIRKCFPLGPLHNPANLSGIEVCEKLLPNTPQVAVFDTAFHQTMPKKAYMYGLPYEFFEKYDVRRYGFHGTSHRYVSKRAAELLGKAPEELRIVTCHLGNGSSISAVDRGRCVDTSMGLTPLEGVIMGTRSGSIDPAIIQYLCEKENLTAEEAIKLCNHKSGLLGITGVTSNMAEVNRLADEEQNEKALLAREMLVYSIIKYVGAYVTVMGGIDALVFTAGIGENSAPVREMVTAGLSVFGIELDREINQSIAPGSGFEGVISTAASKATVLVVPTNEELMIARDTLEIIG